MGKSLYTDMDFWGNIIAILAAVIGWVIAMKSVNKQHKKNLELSREEFKKNLQIQTSDHAIELLVKVRQSLGELNLYLIQLPGRIETVTSNPLNLKLDESGLSPSAKLSDLWNISAKDWFQFTYYFEAREVILFEFNEMKRALLDKISVVTNTITPYSFYLGSLYYSKILPNLPLAENELIELFKKTDELNQHIYDLLGYMMDFQIELQNAFLSDIFNYSIPSREPTDPKFIVLKR